MSRRTSLQSDLAYSLREYVQSRFKPGDCLPPIRELAVKMNVSTITLRAAQSLLVQEGLLAPRHGSGVYVTARAAHRMVGLIAELNIFHPGVTTFFSDVVHWQRGFFAGHQIRTCIYVGEVQPNQPCLGSTCPEFVNDCATRRFDGVIALATDLQPAWHQWLKKYNIPCVSHRQVDYDFTHLVADGLAALRAQGCRTVAVLWWENPGKKPATTNMAELVRAAGLDTRPEWLRHDIHPTAPGAGWDEFREIWSAHDQKPDGLLALDDVLFESTVDAMFAAGAAAAGRLKVAVRAHRLGRRRYPFPVTLLEEDAARLARAQGALLLRLMNGEDPGRLPVKLRHRVVSIPAWGTAPAPQPLLRDAEEEPETIPRETK